MRTLFRLAFFKLLSSWLGPTLRCDYCRRILCGHVHRCWNMRFCSVVCVIAYQQQLSEETKAKLRRLDSMMSQSGSAVWSG
jgi:hypothetical protein